MPVDLVIRNGAVVREDRVQVADIAIDGEKFVEIGPGLSLQARETIDATGLHVFPGLIDSHVHFNEPGRTDWEGISTGSAALAAGGGTCFFDMPLNSSPPVLDGASFDLKLEAMKAKSLTDFGIWGGLTPNNLDKLEELAERGVVGFKAFMCDSGIEDFQFCDDDSLHRGMAIAAKLGVIVAVHAENETIVSARAAELLKDGRTGVEDYLQSRPVVAEVEAIRRAISFARDTACRLHIVHVSSEEEHWEAHVAESLDQFSYETCPHYLLLTRDDMVRLGPIAKCSPPLRTAADTDHLRSVLYTGEITFVASDHSPAPMSMKSGTDFFKLWGGIAGVQSTLAVLMSIKPRLKPDAIGRLTAGNVAKRFGVANKGAIKRGNDADLSLIDLSETYELRREDLLDRHKLSPYVGRRFRGKFIHTIVRGNTVFLDGKIVSKPVGKLVTAARVSVR